MTAFIFGNFSHTWATSTSSVFSIDTYLTPSGDEWNNGDMRLRIVVRFANPNNSSPTTITIPMIHWTAEAILEEYLDACNSGHSVSTTSESKWPVLDFGSPESHFKTSWYGTYERKDRECMLNTERKRYRFTSGKLSATCIELHTKIDATYRRLHTKVDATYRRLHTKMNATYI